MKFRVAGWAVLVILPLVAALGCTESKILESGNVRASIQIEPSPAGGGRYEAIGFQVVQMRVRPLDPDAAAALGGNAIGLVRANTSFDLASPGIVELASTPLAAGSYEIVSVQFDGLLLHDDDPPAVPTTCLENFEDLPSGSIAGDVAGETGDWIVVPAPPAEIVVLPGVDTAVRVTIDAPMLVAAFENSFECRATTRCTAFFPQQDPPCLNSYTDSVFKAGLFAGVTVAQN